MEKIAAGLLSCTSMVLGVLIRKRTIPPISTEYMVATTEEKERFKNDEDVISFISNVFFMTSTSFMTILLQIIFPNIRALKFLVFIFIGLILIYVIYKSISHEIHKDI